MGPFVVNNRQAIGEVHKFLEGMNLQLGEKLAYESHHIISNRRVKNSYAPYVHEAWPNVEKLANGRQTSLLGGLEIGTPHQSDKNLKRGSEDVIELEEETYRNAKRVKLSKQGSSWPALVFQLQLGEVICTPSSLVPEETG